MREFQFPQKPVEARYHMIMVMNDDNIIWESRDSAEAAMQAGIDVGISHGYKPTDVSKLPGWRCIDMESIKDDPVAMSLFEWSSKVLGTVRHLTLKKDSPGDFDFLNAFGL